MMNFKNLTLSLFVLTNANAEPTTFIKDDTSTDNLQVTIQVNEICPVDGCDQFEGSDQPFIKGSGNGELAFTVPSFYSICNNASSHPQMKLTSSNGSTSNGFRLHKAPPVSVAEAYIKYQVTLNGTQLDFAKDVTIPTNSSSKMVLSRVLAADTSSGTYSDTIH